MRSAGAGSTWGHGHAAHSISSPSAAGSSLAPARRRRSAGVRGPAGEAGPRCRPLTLRRPGARRSSPCIRLRAGIGELPSARSRLGPHVYAALDANGTASRSVQTAAAAGSACSAHAVVGGGRQRASTEREWLGASGSSMATAAARPPLGRSLGGSAAGRGQLDGRRPLARIVGSLVARGPRRRPRLGAARERGGPRRRGGRALRRGRRRHQGRRAGPRLPALRARGARLPRARVSSALQLGFQRGGAARDRGCDDAADERATDRRRRRHLPRVVCPAASTASSAIAAFAGVGRRRRSCSPGRMRSRRTGLAPRQAENLRPARDRERHPEAGAQRLRPRASRRQAPTSHDPAVAQQERVRGRRRAAPRGGAS